MSSRDEFNFNIHVYCICLDEIIIIDKIISSRLSVPAWRLTHLDEIRQRPSEGFQT
jgi:hypothetical protein